MVRLSAKPSLEVVTPAEWGQPPVDPDHVATRALAVVDEANVHHSDSDPPERHGGCFAAVRGFDTYHRSEGWAGLGYSRVICPHGAVFLGRPLAVVPAAAKDHNTPIVAYCLIAKDGAANLHQWAALLRMAARDAQRVGRPLKWTTHREVWPYTECPGDAIQHQVDVERKHHPTVPTMARASKLLPRRAKAAADLAAALPRRQNRLTAGGRRLLLSLRASIAEALHRG